MSRDQVIIEVGDKVAVTLRKHGGTETTICELRHRPQDTGDSWSFILSNGKEFRTTDFIKLELVHKDKQADGLF